MDEEIAKLDNKWRHWHYKNTALLVASLVCFLLLADSPSVKAVISWAGSLGYIGAFFAGILFVSIFTVGPASVALFYLARSLNPFGIAIAAGLGGMIGDYLIFKFLKDRVFEELKPVFINHGGKPLKKLFKTPYFSWILPIVGVILIMSPLPDEIGLGLLGISRLKTWPLLGFLFLLNTSGIFLVIILAKALSKI